MPILSSVRSTVQTTTTTLADSFIATESVSSTDQALTANTSTTAATVTTTTQQSALPTNGSLTVALTNDTALIGGLAGGVAALVAVLVAATLTVVLCRRRHKRNDAISVPMAPAPAQYDVSPLATLPANDYGMLPPQRSDTRYADPSVLRIDGINVQQTSVGTNYSVAICERDASAP